MDLLSRTAADWRNEILYNEASAAHAEKLQNQVATLEAKFYNPSKGIPADLALKASFLANKQPQGASQTVFCAEQVACAHRLTLSFEPMRALAGV